MVEHPFQFGADLLAESLEFEIETDARERPLQFDGDPERFRCALDGGLYGRLDPAHAEQVQVFVKKLLDVAKGPKNVEVREVFHPGMSHYRPKWAPGSGGRRSFGLPSKVNPFVAAHEVGHATGSPIRKALQRAMIGGRIVAPLGGLGMLGHAALTADPGEDMAWTGYAAPALPAAQAVVQQAEELRASLRARKLLRRAGVKVPKMMSQILRQQVGYALPGLASIAPFALGSYLLHRNQESMKEELAKKQGLPAAE